MAEQREPHTKKSTEETPSAKISSPEFRGSYYTLVENAPDIIFVIDLEGHFLYLNKTAQKITGYPLSDLLKRNLQDIVPLDHQDNIKKIFQRIKEIAHAPYHSLEIVSPNGTRIPLDIHFKPIKDTNGQAMALQGIARDVTERKKFEETLRESEKKYSTLVEKAKDGVVILQDGICKFVNKAIQEISGYSEDELLGKPLFDKFAPQDREVVAKRYKQRIAGEDVPSVYKVKIICKDGTEKELEISAAVIPFEGRPASLGIVRDLSERKKMYDALQKSEEKYRILVENIDDVIFILDDKGHFTYISPAIQNYNGLAPKDLKGKSFSDLAHPDEKAQVSEALKRILKGDKNPHEFRLRHHDGEARYVRICCRPLSEENLDAGILGIATDITDRKKVIEELNQAYKEVQDTEAKLKAIIDNAPNIAIQGFNKKGEVLLWNPTAEKLFGLGEEEAKGKTLKDILASEEEEKVFKKLLDETFEKNKPSSLKEWELTSKEGKTKHYLRSLFPICLPDQEPLAIAMHVDISERKNVEEKVEEVNRQIERFSKISADILAIEEEEDLFNRIAKAVVDISDYSRVLISYFIDEPPYRKILGYKGISRRDLEQVEDVEMPREKYLHYFEKGKKIGSQSCYIPHTIKDILDKSAVITSDKKYPDEDGGWHSDDNLLVAMKDTQGQVIGIISVDDSKTGLAPTTTTVGPLEIFANLISEIIQRRDLVKKIKDSEEKYRELIRNIKVGIFRATPQGKLQEINPTALEVFGYKSDEEFLKLKLADLFHKPEDNQIFMKEIEREGIVKSREFILTKKDGANFWASLTSTAVSDDFGQLLYYDTVVEDISDRKKLEEKIQHLSVTDELSELYNRRYFNQNLPKEVQNAEKWRSSISLIMIDIDDFKPYNDTYHHLKGDEVIKEAAKVIAQSIRNESDWASRFGGDEFAIILPGTALAEATTIADRIRKAFQEIKFRPDRNVIQKTLSMGISHCYYKDFVFKHPTVGPKREYERIATDLIKLADKALYEAKTGGKNRIVVSKGTIELTRVVDPT